MSKGFLTLLLMCYVPLRLSAPDWACFLSCTMVERQSLSAVPSSSDYLPRDPSHPPPMWNSLPTLVSSLETL